jgi:hypothetical protein
MSQVIIYPNDNGTVAIVYPAPDCGMSIQQIAEKDVPEGKPFQIIDSSLLPTDVEFRNAWMYTEE